MSSPSLVSGFHEVWAFGPNDFRELFDVCGLYGSRADADRAAGELETWLHTAVWSDRLHPDLLTARRDLRAVGVDPAAVDVCAVYRGQEADSAVRAPTGSRYAVADDEDGDEELPDTMLQPVGEFDAKAMYDAYWLDNELTAGE